MVKRDVLYNQMPPTRRQVLLVLKQKGGLSADDLSKELGITTVAVRRHLANLERDHLVEHEQVKRQLGRPSFIYHLTDAAQHLFPGDYDRLAYSILQAAEDLFGPQAIARIFEELKQRQTHLYRTRMTEGSLPDRLDELVRLREADGYIVTWQEMEGGSYLLNHHHCPIARVAQACNAACEAGREMLADLLDAEVIPREHQLTGDTVCSYEVRPRS